MLTLSSNKQSRVILLLNDILVENRRSDINTNNKITEMKAEILSAVTSKSTIRNTQNFTKVGTTCMALAEEGGRVAATQKVLRSLNFTYIMARQSTIKEAHKKTFEWIFEEAKHGGRLRPTFLSWLKKGNGIY